MAQNTFETVEGYISAQPESVKTILNSVRSAIQDAVPGADESIAYKMPTYKLHGALVLHFACWRHHYSLYPSSDRLVAAFKEELSPYEIDNSTIKFPLSKPVPIDLVARIARFRAEEVSERETTKQADMEAS
jgi:uncharacterized protein YdhG (YjbR/CyaY superfamily)